MPILVVILSVPHDADAQSTYFNEIKTNKDLLSKNKKYDYTITPDWRFVFSGPAWNRISLRFQVKRSFDAWSFGAGLGEYYTTDQIAGNSFEIRPYILVGLKTPFLKKFLFTQTLKHEYRSFFYANDSRNNNTDRVRYDINLLYSLKEDKSKGSYWQVRPEVEWYLKKNSDIKERFVSSAAYTFSLIRGFSKKLEIALEFSIEKFNKNFYNNYSNGKNITVEVSL